MAIAELWVEQALGTNKQGEQSKKQKPDGHLKMTVGIMPVGTWIIWAVKLCELSPGSCRGV